MRDPRTVPEPEAAPALDVRGLRVTFVSQDRKGQDVLAVDGVDLSVRRGEVLSLVGESGSGKSTVLLALAGLLPANAVLEGEVWLHGRSILALPERERARIRGRRVGMVFQDP